ncbi:MAG: hypothetical protein IJS09_10995 [Treponema sp.]|nr:hypothetical protein [Treponema sp.]
MKKFVFMLFACCVVSLGFSQTKLTPKKKVVSPQFEKLTKYGITNNSEPVFIWDYHGFAITMHLENAKDGILIYGSKGGMRGNDDDVVKKGTIITGYSGKKIEMSMLIFDYSRSDFGIFAYVSPSARVFYNVEKSAITLDDLIDKLVEDRTDLQWIKDEM